MSLIQNKLYNRLSCDVIQKIKQLEIYTRRLLNGALVGDNRSALKGTGFEFDQIREYTFGDDIRFVDWKASARCDKLLIKQYIEERSRTIFLMVDISRSREFGALNHTKHIVFAEIASVLALVAQHGKDRVGLILFSNEVELYVPPANNLNHVRVIMEHLFVYKSKYDKTNVSTALEYMLSLKKSDAMVFLFSDFIVDDVDTYLGQVAKRHDLIAFRCLDEHEKMLPAVGFITVEDLETGELVELDVRSLRQNEVGNFLNTRLEEQNKIFKKYGIDLFDISLDKKDYIPDIVKFFRRRMMY